MTTSNEFAAVVMRNLRPRGLDRVVEVDRRNPGRSLWPHCQIGLAPALADTGIQVSLAAGLDGAFVRLLLARVHYGEFGALERSVVRDAIAVHPRCHGGGVGRARARIAADRQAAARATP